MKLFDLLKVVGCSEIVSVLDADGNALATFECDDVVGFDENGSAFVREENNDPSILEKEVVSVFTAVIEPFGLPGVNVIVK